MCVFVATICIYPIFISVKRKKMRKIIFIHLTYSAVKERFHVQTNGTKCEISICNRCKTRTNQQIHRIYVDTKHQPTINNTEKRNGVRCRLKMKCVPIANEQNIYIFIFSVCLYQFTFIRLPSEKFVNKIPKKSQIIM